ncbi:MAG: DUF302 domain-containing protein [Thiobacillaceae bacterium]|nr:DUF302 domain-containing protein [Thiobacillaceae bacterium]MDW8323827.1 DUF302 domain-containing protein [Burkholderiales bacterium]
MLKAFVGFVAGVLATVVGMYFAMPHLMFNEIQSPFGFEETIARIQHNIVGNPELKAKGWALSGLRDPARAVAAEGGNVLPVKMVEVCSTRYSKPILKDDTVRYLSILMPCKVSVYKKNDGKVYIATMNAGLMGKFFGPTVGEIMSQVAEDQKLFVVMDPSKPAPPMILPTAAPAAGGGGAGAAGGC